MRAQVLGITVQNDRTPSRGERIAAWVERYMRNTGLTAGEIAWKVGADKRDIRRLLADRSCGPRLNDDLEAAFGWDFVEQVATPIVGADPITAREREIANERNELAAREARLERLRAATKAAIAAPQGALRLVAEEGRPFAASGRLGNRGASADGGEE